MRGVCVSSICLVLATASSAQTGNGFVGIYADADGTQPCAYVAPYTATALYVIAKTGAASADGISGTEFRIEVSSPAGWLLSYTAPAGTQALGNPIDVDPNPLVGGGLDLAFAACQTPTNGMVHLGTLTVFNVSGTATTLLVKKHTTPANSNFACPLFVLCDAPVYTQLCMGTSAEQSGCIAPLKAHRTTQSEPIAFELIVNPSASPEVPGAAFATPVDLGACELWVLGEEIQGPQLACVFDGTVLRVADIPVPVSAIQAPQPVFADAELANTYSVVPVVQARTSAGMTIVEAVAMYQAEREALYGLARAALRDHGVSAAREVLRASPLVERVGDDSAYVKFWMRGLQHSFLLEPETPSPSPERTAQKVVSAIVDAVAGSTLEGSLILVTHDGVARIAGALKAEARAQIEYLKQGGDPRTIPEGPLRPADSFVQDISRKRAKQVRGER